MDREELQVGNFKEAIKFSAYPSVLVYNLIATVIIGLSLYFFTFRQINNPVNVTETLVSVSTQGINPLFILAAIGFLAFSIIAFRNISVYSAILFYNIIGVVLFFTAYIFIYNSYNNNLEGEKGLSPITGLFQNLISDNSQQSFGNDVQAGFTFSLITLFILILLSLKNIDITAQIVEEDFGRPSWNLGYYLSFKSLGKYFLALLAGLVIFITVIWLTIILLTSFITTSGLGKSLISCIVFIETLYFIGLYPAIILTFIRTEDFFKTINPKENSRTINYFVGQKNYLMLAGLVCSILLLVLVYALVIEVAGFNVWTLVFAIVICYLCLHYLSTIHYLVGLLSGYSEIIEEEKVTDEYELDFPEFIEDVKFCISNGYPEDAITLLNNVIETKSESPSAILTMFKLLIDTYKIKQDNKKANKIRHDMVAYTYKDAPHLKKKVMPIMVDLFMDGELQPKADEIRHLAEAAYKRRKYKAVPKLVNGFIQKNPQHPDIVDNYYWLANTLIVKKEYTKAYRILLTLIKKYPQHPRIIDIRSEALKIKSKLDPRDKPKNKLAEP